ncbi:MAG: hypothetical protein JO048_10610 [Methylobacteriaceae bacterium]|nr:hypothetical protein [Methylobacteriaceae bacterium]
MWGLTCSRHRLNGFGGGAQLIDLGLRRSLAWLDCEHWLRDALDPERDAQTGVARSALPGGEPAMGIGLAAADDGEAGIATPSAPAD